MKVWTQWPDLNLPAGVTALPTDGKVPADSDLAEIEFYVPAYMSGPTGLNPIKGMNNLKIIQSPNAGYDDVLQVLPDGVTLCNAAGVHDASTAELAVGLLIGARRGFAQFMQDQIKGNWNHTHNKALADSKVGIVGAGNIGKTIGAMLSHSFVETIFFSRSGKDGALTMDKFDQLLPSLDVVILILPLTAESRHLMNATRLAAMKDGATLVNVARGAVVDTDALVRELHSGRITAGLDVTDPEPLPAGHPLWSAPNCIISPHVGGDSTAFTPRGRALVEAQLGRLARGESLANVVAGPAR